MFGFVVGDGIAPSLQATDFSYLCWVHLYTTLPNASTVSFVTAKGSGPALLVYNRNTVALTLMLRASECSDIIHVRRDIYDLAFR